MNRWGNLNMEQKAQLLGIYASKGYTDLASIINHYNTFQAGGRLTFNEWKSQMQSKYPDIEMDNAKAGYDYVRYFNDNYDDAIRQLSELKHFPDTYKLPNHKTFSNESIYSRGPMMGGNWVNDSTFSPSVINRQQYPNIYKEDRPYTEREIYGDKYQKGGRLYQKGGPTNNKSDWAKVHEVELALQQLGWDNPGNRLHSDYAAKDANGYYAGYNLKPVAIAAKHPLWDLHDYQGKEDNPNINAHKDELYQNRRKREEAGKEYLKNIGRVGLTMATLPILGYGATTAPLATGLSLAGGEGLNYGINKLTPYDSWGNMLAEGMFNTDNELAQTALEFTNPGFLLGPKAAPFVNNQYRGLRVANELRKGIRNTELQPRIAKNTAHTRTKLGDVEVDDPNLMYHVDNGDYTGFSDNGAYVKDGMLFPSQHSNGQKPYTWWNLGRPYRNGQTRLLTTTKDNPSLLRVRDQDYPIGQWTGNPKDRTFVTNQEYVSSEPIRIGNEYKLDPNYGYRRTQNPNSTLDMGEVWRIENDYNNIVNTNDWSLLPSLRARHFKLLSGNAITDNEGNLLNLWHGTPNGHFNMFRQQGGIGRATNIGFYSTPNKDYASRYTARDIRWGTPSETPAILELYGRGNLVPDRMLGNFPATVLQHTTPENVLKIRNLGYDGIRSANLLGKRAEINLFDPNNYKSKAAVTYDDLGNIIPLSKRDNFSNLDMRYKNGGKLK